MGPKKGKKSKGETEEQKAAREEAERIAKEAEAKRIAEEKERQRLEDLRIQAERKLFREKELERLSTERVVIDDIKQTKLAARLAEEAKEVY